MSNNKVLNFAMIGAAGYIAPRHMNAIQSIGGNLVAAYDKFDSVGIMDRYFPTAAFFTEFERFDRHLDKLQRKGHQVDYLVICSPNYLHDAHIRFGLRNGMKVICEKPVVLNIRNLESLIDIEHSLAGKVNAILQLRLHPEVIRLKKKLEIRQKLDCEIELSYITARGNWYYASWKGEESKSGGICTNIGVHFFDLLVHLFGPVQDSIVVSRTHDRASGILQLQSAKIKWFLSINSDTLPQEAREKGQKTYRKLTIDGEDFDFSQGFEDLHELSYQQIINNQGFGLSDTYASIELVEQLRTAKLERHRDAHYLTSLVQTNHPFQRT